jgi:hypothetical protein
MQHRLKVTDGSLAYNVLQIGEGGALNHQTLIEIQNLII